MFDVKFDDKEIKAITDNIKRLQNNWAKNAIRRGLRKSANIIRDQAKINAQRIDDPETASQIYKNIATAAGGKKREQHAGGIMMRVGVMGGAKPLKKGTETGLSGGNTTHWRLIEFGTSIARAQPFMRPAMNEKAQEALNTMLENMREELKKEVLKRA